MAQKLEQPSKVVLLIDDESQVLDSTARMLAQMGCRVLSSQTPEHALRLWQEHAGDIDFLLTDVVLPGPLSGELLARRCHMEKPGLKIIFMSGFSRESLGEIGHRIPPSVRFIQKPFRFLQLKEALG